MWIGTGEVRIGVLTLLLLASTAETRAEELPLIDEPDLPSKVEQMAGAENSELAVLLAPLAAPPSAAGAAPEGNGLKDMQRVPDDTVLPGLDAEALIGARVLDATGRASGRVEALLGDETGTPLAVLAHSGGFLGVGGRRFVVPLDALDLSAADGQTVPSSIDRSQIDLLPSSPSRDD